MSTVAVTAPPAQETLSPDAVPAGRGAGRWEDLHAWLAHPVVVLSLILIAAQTGLRAWTLFPSWFYHDDYRLLAEARAARLTWDFLATPYDSQFMPMGRLITWVTARTGGHSFVVASASTLLFQTAAGVACLWMMTTLFGRRWQILPFLSAYLFTCLNLPAAMWWAAALNQVPFQLVFFVAVTAWVLHLRTREARWLTLTVLALIIGLLAYVKTLLIGLVLVWLAAAYFARGGPLRRSILLCRSYPRAVAAGAAVAGGYLGYYLTHVPSLRSPGRVDWTGLVHLTVGRSFGTAMLGGPWRWDETMAPVSEADPPTWATITAWVLIVGCLVGSLVLRRRTLRAWSLLAWYLVALVVLVGTGRAGITGPRIGLQLRYLTDMACVLPLTLALVMLPLHGSHQPSARRRRALPAWTAIVVTTLLTASACYSTITYMHGWHSTNPGKRFVARVETSLAGRTAVDAADVVLPEAVAHRLLSPYNTAAHLLPLVVDRLRFPETTDHLAAVDRQGNLREARMSKDSATTARGPVPGCGYRLTTTGARLELSRSLEAPFGSELWLRVGYVAGDDTAVVVKVADSTQQVDLHEGLGEFYVKVHGRADAVSISAPADQIPVCVGDGQVGQIEPGGPLR